MMYNRYRGNGSKPEKLPEPEQKREEKRQMSAPARPVQKSKQHDPKNGLTTFIPQKLGELETEDLLLILILYLMYRESGDKELLIIMGAMYLL